MSSVATPASWLFSIINGARNGFFYGIFVRPLPPRRSIARPAADAARAGRQVRTPHALLMTSLFKYERLGGFGSLQFWNEIVKLASTHARSLGGFALVYKAAQSVIGASTGLPRTNPLMSMVPAFAIGAWIWGFKNSVSEQFNMYLLSRVLATGLFTLGQRGYLPFADGNAPGM